MAKLKLIETIQSKLSTLLKTDGQLIVVRDNASLYVDLDGSRIYISDWIDVSTDNERLSMLAPLSNKYYYVIETNKIWRYVSGNWILVTSLEECKYNPIQLTQAEFDALSEEEQNNGTYIITDADVNGDASNVAYDNSTSGLNSINVQGAIDEINGEVDSVNTKIGVIRNITFPNTLGAEAYGRPWLELEAQVSKLEIGVDYLGSVTAGTRWVFFGRMQTSTYGSFIIHSYVDNKGLNELFYLITCTPSGWKYEKLNNQSDITSIQTSVGKLKYEWTATIQSDTWQRLCYVSCASGYRNSLILHVAIHRSGVVHTDTFIVNAVGSGYGTIVKIGSNYPYSAYSKELSVRIVSNANGSTFFEIYENGNGIAYTSQTVYCSLIPLSVGEVTAYTEITDGTTIPDGYTVAKEMTVTKTDFQSDVTDVINSRLEANVVKTTASLVEATSTSMYTFPSDGYVKLSIPANHTAIFNLFDSAGNEIGAMGRTTTTEAYSYNNMLCIKKGMKAFMSNVSDTTEVSCIFNSFDV